MFGKTIMKQADVPSIFFFTPSTRTLSILKVQNQKFHYKYFLKRHKYINSIKLPVFQLPHRKKSHLDKNPIKAPCESSHCNASPSEIHLSL